jgi:peptidoglycan/xylan/chitin deacetylase (PgdA/CDA1 family)
MVSDSSSRRLRLPEAGTSIVVLNFHGVGEPPRALELGEASVWLLRDAFEAALDAVAGRDDVRITFDDGNASDVTIALPALLARGLAATFFLPAAFVGRPHFVDEDDIRALTEAGMQIGSHGMDHRPWPTLDDSELKREVIDARDRLEEWSGQLVVEAACPFGAYDRRTLAALRDGGFERVFTSDRGRTSPDAWLQPRNTIHRDDRADDVDRIVSERPGAVGSLVRATRLAVKRWR